MPPSKEFAIALADCRGYECMTFSQSDFNMCRDEQMIAFEYDVDLVVDHFSSNKGIRQQLQILPTEGQVWYVSFLTLGILLL